MSRHDATRTPAPDVAPEDSSRVPPADQSDQTAAGDDHLEARLRAVERAVVEGEPPPEGLADAATLAGDLEDLAGRLDDLEDRVDDLAAATQAVRGYVGEVRSVNESVEASAGTALERVEALAERVDALEDRSRGPAGPGDAAEHRSPGHARVRSGRATPRGRADESAPGDRGERASGDVREASRGHRVEQVESTQHGWQREQAPSGDALEDGVVSGPGPRSPAATDEGLLARLRSWL